MEAFGRPKAVTSEDIMWNLTQAMAPFLDNQQMFHLFRASSKPRLATYFQG